MQRYKIKIEYEGTPFVGWQFQKNGQSVQEVIQKAIQSLVPSQKEIDQRNSIRNADKAQRQEKEKQNRKTVREKQKAVKGFSGGYGF